MSHYYYNTSSETLQETFDNIHNNYNIFLINYTKKTYSLENF